MQSNFEIALAHVLDFEGGYSDHPSDPGGATNLGITHEVLQAYRGRPVSKQDVRTLTVEEAKAIYRSRYWDAASCGALPRGIDLAVFDCAVNQGVGRAVRLLQQAAHVRADGVIGPITLAAVSKTPGEKLLTEFMARRMNAYGRLQRLFRTFGLGWSRRLMATHREALSLLDSSKPAEPPSAVPQQPTPTRTPSMIYILRRLQEPSTYAGLAAILAALGLLNLTEQEWNDVFGAIAAVAGALAILLHERPETGEDSQSPSTDQSGSR